MATFKQCQEGTGAENGPSHSFGRCRLEQDVAPGQLCDLEDETCALSICAPSLHGEGCRRSNKRVGTGIPSQSKHRKERKKKAELKIRELFNSL